MVALVDETADVIRENIKSRKRFAYLSFNDADLSMLATNDEVRASFLCSDDGYMVASVAGQTTEQKMRDGIFARSGDDSEYCDIVNSLRPSETLHNAVALQYKSAFDPHWFIDFCLALQEEERVALVAEEGLCNDKLVNACFGIKETCSMLDLDCVLHTCYDNKIVLFSGDTILKTMMYQAWLQTNATIIDIGTIANALADKGSMSWFVPIRDQFLTNYRVPFLNNAVDIVLVTKDHWQMTDKCISNVAKYSNDYKVWWVDNGSFEYDFNKTKESAKQLEECQLISNTSNKGFSKAANKALRKIQGNSRSKYVVFLDNDLYVTKHWLKRLLVSMEVNGYDAITPLMSEGNPHSCSSVLNNPPEFESSDANARNEVLWKKFGMIGVRSDMVYLSCCVVRREVFDKIGLLDEDFFVMGEDNDFSMRMGKAGLEMGLALGVYVEHDYQGTLSDNGKDWIADKQKKAVELLKKKHGS